MGVVRFAGADRTSNLPRGYWFPAGWFLFGIGQGLVVGEVWPSAMPVAVTSLFMTGDRIVARRAWMTADEEGIAWSVGLGAPRHPHWTGVDRVEEHVVDKRGSLVRSVRVTGRDGATHRLPLPRSHSFFDPDPDFERQAALIIDLSQARLSSVN